MPCSTVNEVLDTEYRSNIVDFYKNAAIEPASRQYCKDRKCMPHNAGNDVYFDDYGKEDTARAPIDSLKRATIKSVEPGSARALFTTGSIVDMAEYYMESAHDTGASVPMRFSPKISAFLLTAVLLYESSRIF